MNLDDQFVPCRDRDAPPFLGFVAFDDFLLEAYDTLALRQTRTCSLSMSLLNRREMTNGLSI